jgi:hypothetical protein
VRAPHGDELASTGLWPPSGWTPTGRTPPSQRRGLHTQAARTAAKLIEVWARKEHPGVSVVISGKPIAPRDLPKHEITIEEEFPIPRASKKYLGIPIELLPARVYHGLADIAEFVPWEHRAQIWEVKQSSIGPERAALEALHYVERFDTSEARAGYRAVEGGAFPGERDAPPLVRNVRYGGLPGSVLYDIDRGRRIPRPTNEPHPINFLDPRWIELVALALALGLARRRGGRGAGKPAPEPGFARSLLEWPLEPTPVGPLLGARWP